MTRAKHTALKVRRLIALLSCLLVALAILPQFKPIEKQLNPLLLRSLIQGTDRGYIPLGAQFRPYKKYLAGNASISFISDQPQQNERLEIKKLYREAQNFLSPTIINAIAEEDIALVYCSDDLTARVRMIELGYAPIMELRNGKTVAKKTS